MQIPNKPFIYTAGSIKHLLKLMPSTAPDRCIFCFFEDCLDRESDTCDSPYDTIGECGDSKGVYYFKHIKSKPIKHTP